MTFGDFETSANAMVEAVRVAGQNGMLTLIHCEDGAPNQVLLRPVARGRARSRAG
jgi:hypothetical protein